MSRTIWEPARLESQRSGLAALGGRPGARRRVFTLALILIVGGCGGEVAGVPEHAAPAGAPQAPQAPPAAAPDAPDPPPPIASEPCGAGTWDDDGDPATRCVAWSTCGPGSFVRAQGTAASDRQCAPCPVGQTSTTANVAACSIVQGETLVAGLMHTCALDAGLVRCWGFNGRGSLGDGSTTSRATPAPVPGLAGVAALASGINHTCARLTDGSVRCWGDNRSGQLGDGSKEDRQTPTAVPGLASVVEVVAGEWHTCARLADETVTCWGDGKVSPTPVAGLAGVAGLAAGYDRTCARLTDGTVRCWRRGGVVTAVPGLSGVVEITARNHHACALQADGAVRCWGRNQNGQLGDGTVAADSAEQAPTAVKFLSGAVDLSAGWDYTCALLTDRSARCWGWNGAGQLGDGTTSKRLVPTPVQGLSAVAAIATGGAHTCARLTDGSLRCWGVNAWGQVGDGTTTPRPSPTPVL